LEQFSGFVAKVMVELVTGARWSVSRCK